MKPYSIISPPYEVTSGGIRVMFALKSWLEIKGQIAHMNVRFENPDFIAIYPEIAHGNSAQANTVVRYILNEVGVMGSNGVPGQTKFPETDHIFVFSKLFDTFGVDDDHLLFLPVINLHEFYDKHQPRPNKCYFVGKGVNTSVHPDDAIEVSRTTAHNQSALSELLNTCEVMYCYDPVSAMHDIARLCGCRVVMINPKYTKKQFQKYELAENGMSWYEDEGIKLHSNTFREHYKDLRDQFSDKIDRFIELTQ